jgi:hypothetical protein
MPVTVKRGYAGAINGIPHVMRWVTNDRSKPPPWRSSQLSRGTGRIAGNTDWDGHYAAYGHTPTKMPTDTFTFTGSEDGTYGVQGDAVVDLVRIQVDIENGRPIAHLVRFSAHDTALDYGEYTASDASTSGVVTSVGRIIETATAAAEPDFSETCSITKFDLLIWADNSPYNTGCTDGITHRVPGNIDARCSWQQFFDDPSALPSINSVISWRGYVTASLYWDINWFVIDEVANFTVDIEGRTLVGADIQGSWTGKTMIGSTNTTGHIKKPGGTSWWPFE